MREDVANAVAVSLVHTWIEYANSVVHWQTNSKRLQSVQNSVTTVVLKKGPELSTNELLHKLHWLPFQSRIAF